MAGTKKSLGILIIVALVLVLLYALNPTTDDFKAWRSAQAQSQASGGSSGDLKGVLSKGAGAIAGAMTGLVAGGYKRNDYLVCSTYSLGGDLYLGVAHLFIVLK
jgi:hypothetical protein